MLACTQLPDTYFITFWYSDNDNKIAILALDSTEPDFVAKNIFDEM